MKKVLLRILLAVVICVVIYLIWLPGQKPTPLRLSEGVYTGSYFDGDRPYEFILEVKSPLDLSIYKYSVSYDDVIVGRKTDYTYSGKNYNHLFWNLYIYPESSLFFWNNIRRFDYSGYARIRMESVKTFALNGSTSPDYGGYTEDVNADDSLIILGPIWFTIPEEDDEIEMAEKVIKVFAEEGREVN